MSISITRSYEARLIKIDYRDANGVEGELFGIEVREASSSLNERTFEFKASSSYGIAERFWYGVSRYDSSSGEYIDMELPVTPEEFIACGKKTFLPLEVILGR